MVQNENISLSLANKIDILNKSQSVDARYGVYKTEGDALDAMTSYGLDGRLVAVYTDISNGKVKVYKYNQVLHQLEPIDDQALALTLEQTRTNNNTVEGVILGSEEFDKGGNRKAFAQIADIGDALQNYIREPATDGTPGQVLTTDGSGGRSWTTALSEVEWGDISGDQSDVNISGFTNDAGFITEDVVDSAIEELENQLAPVALSNDYNDLDNLPSLDFIPTSEKGTANGVAPTGADNKIPLSFFPDAILGQVLFGGTVVPATGVATLSNNAKTKLGTTDSTITLTNNTAPITGYGANEGIYYIAFDNGTFAGISLEIGDWLISTGSNWTKIDNTDAVTMVNGKTGAVTLNSEDIPYNNTTSGLLAENAQELGDELQANIEQEAIDRQLAIETAGFVQRTGTAISFDKWAIYGSYSSPLTGDLSYSFTDMVRGMVVLLYHNDSVPPVITQAGVTITNSGDYIENAVNLFRIHCVENNNLEIFVKTLN